MQPLPPLFGRRKLEDGLLPIAYTGWVIYPLPRQEVRFSIGPDYDTSAWAVLDSGPNLMSLCAWVPGPKRTSELDESAHMNEPVKPSAIALLDALQLSDAILRGVELSEIPLTNAALMTSRLARLLNDFTSQKIFQYEAGGYPTTASGVSQEVWALARSAGRVYQKKDKVGSTSEFAIVESIEQLEAQVDSGKIGLDAARDVSVTSANPNQFVSTLGNGMERLRLHNELKEAVKKLGARRSFLYTYVVQKNLELKFSAIAGDAFARIRERVDTQIGSTVPDATQKFSAIYDNLRSDNPEDWSNAVHGCRRVLQDLADALFPATGVPREKQVGSKTISVSLGPDNYINRLMCFAEDRSASDRYLAIVGSQLSFLGDRLDALFRAAQKGSHGVISTREEADRCVVYTYMAVGDLLQLQTATTD